MQYSYHPVVFSHGSAPIMSMPHNGIVTAYHMPAAGAPAPGPYAVQARPPVTSTTGSQSPPQEMPQAQLQRVSSNEGSASVSSQDKTHRIDNSIEDTHAIAQSVLLLAKGGHHRAASANPASSNSTNKRDSPSMDSIDSKVPLKKRKIGRPQQHTGNSSQASKDENASLRVSPVSHGSHSHVLSPASQTHATSCDGSKAHHTPERTNGMPPAQVVVVSHLPTELYRLLEATQGSGVHETAANNAQGIIQWLPHGRAWRIVRWDALRKQILPRSFGGTSVDSFLAQLADWGFIELTDGPDAGAYYNPFFRRGFPHLCKDMQCKPRQHEDDATSPIKSPPNAHSPGLKHETTPHTHVSAGSAASSHPSILQVPSLASPQDSRGAPNPSSPPTTKRVADSPPRSSPQSYGTYVSVPGRPHMPFWFVDANQQAVLVQYRPSNSPPTDDAAVAATHSPTNLPYSRGVVRSTRGRPAGALRRNPIVTPVRRAEDSCASSTASVGGSSYHSTHHRRGFPVSRRGRARSLARPISHSSASSMSGASSASVSHPPHVMVTPAPAEKPLATV